MHKNIDVFIYNTTEIIFSWMSCDLHIAGFQLQLDYFFGTIPVDNCYLYQLLIQRKSMPYYTIANKIFSDVTIISVNNMIYQEIPEIWYSFSKRPDEYRILNFINWFLDGNEIC